MSAEIREYERHVDRGALHIVREDGCTERLTRRRPELSGAMVWPIVALLVVCAFIGGVQIGKRSPTLPPVPVADYSPRGDW